MKPRPGFDDEFQPKGWRWYTPVRSIGRLMMVVVAAGLLLAILAGMGKHKINKRHTRIVVQPPIQNLRANAPVAQPPDPFVVMAAAEIDPKMVVPAPAGIDDKMVLNPDTHDRQPGLTVPPYDLLFASDRTIGRPGAGRRGSAWIHADTALKPERTGSMADTGDAIEWNIVTLAAWWNLYGLPVLLVVVAIVVWVRRRFHPAATAGLDDKQTVRRVGLIHCGLALQALMYLVQELMTHVAMGIPESHIRLVGVLIGTVVNAPLGIGLLLRRPLARWFAIAWYVLLSLVAIVGVAWLLYYSAAIDPAFWPEPLISKAMPVFLLVVMLLPRTRRVFATRAREALPGSEPSNQEAPGQTPLPAGWPVVPLLTLLLLILVCSNLTVDAADWGYRLIFELEPVP